MSQYVCPNLEESKSFKEKQDKLKEELIIHAGFQSGMSKDVQGLMNLETHEISIGCSEKDVPEVLWHEQMHKLLLEMFSLKETILWDKIADDLGKMFFESTEEKLNYFGQTHLTDKTNKLQNFSLERRK